jgi:hypothetical protein
MEMIKITDKFPPFDKQVIFRAKTTWRNKDTITFFDDKVTRNEATLEYGQTAYILDNHCDYLVSDSPHINELCDEFVTHWCEIPEIID